MNDQETGDDSRATAKDVAEWMLSKFVPKKPIYQDSMVGQIRKRYGSTFTYTNKNGNLAINKDVLDEFRRLSEGKVVWVKGERCWRLLKEGEAYKGRQVE